MKTAVISHSDCRLHDMGSDHPESPERLRAIERYFKGSCLIQEVTEREAQPASYEQIRGGLPKGL